MNSEIKQSGSVMKKIDNVLIKIMTGFSFIGVAAIIIMACLAVGDIIAAKVFGGAIKNQYQWIQYSLLAVVFCFLPIITLKRGMMSVDILTRKFSAIALKIIEFISYIAGTAVFGFLTYRGFILLNKHIVEKTASANVSTAFKIWPFTLIYCIGLLFLAISCLWRAIRTAGTFSAKESTAQPASSAENEKEVK